MNGIGRELKKSNKAVEIMHFDIRFEFSTLTNKFILIVNKNGRKLKKFKNGVETMHFDIIF